MLLAAVLALPLALAAQPKAEPMPGDYRIVQPADASSAADRSAALDALIEEVLRRERGPRSLIAMPAWDDDPQVRPHVLNLYAYLSARADGKLGPSRPRR